MSGSILHTVKNKQVKFVTVEEYKKLLSAAKETRYPTRNELIIMMLYSHGLRESELINITLDDIILSEARIKIHRMKNGKSGIHNIEGKELRLLKRYLRERNSNLPWLFLSEQKTQMHRNTIARLVNICTKLSNIDKKISPHMLRHGCGYYLVNKNVNIRVIQDYLGHKDIANTAIYTSLDSNQYKGLFADI
ncbi:MAG: tyrosine-type recombinase/integrase [Anaplasmataceae bacterium]|nr:tyrosine-type recombinase/integrase [Candidatus Heimdallarchaeota archaeon]MDH5796119.1 tyrosine-type recombinase/integrase [Anaplasmataceae bacterium]